MSSRGNVQPRLAPERFCVLPSLELCLVLGPACARYYRKALNLKFFGVDSNDNLVALIKDAAALSDSAAAELTSASCRAVFAFKTELSH